MTTEISTQEQFQEQMKARIRAAAGELMPDEMLQEIVKRGIEELERELKASFVRCGEWATKAGEAQGRLEASEMAGTVRRWRERATAAEARIDELGKHNKALEQNLQAARDDYAELERERDTIIDSLPEEHRQHTTGIIESVKRLVKSEGGCAERATAAEAERDKLREALAKLTLKWRMDDFNGNNFPTKREAAYEVEAALKEPVKSNELLCPPHKCRCIARIHNMAPGRDWWLGELTEPVPEWPHETHCLHITTPLKSVVFLCNRGDLSGLAVLCDIPFPIVNETWRERMSDAYKRAALKEPTDA
jgi:chromosome segregation ATPase